MGLFDKKFDLKLGSLFLKDSAAFTNMMLNGLPAQLNVPVSAPQLNFDSTEFDPNAGRLEAYNKRWNAYLNTLAKDNNKINVKKARKYFDSQFELDWENEYADRFSSAIDNSMERLKAQSMDLVSKNYEDNGYTFDGANWILPEESTTPLQSTPQQPALAPSGHSMYWWLQQAQKYNPNFKSIEDVTNWQKENGLVADGKFGKNSLAKWNELAANKKKFDEEQTLAALESAKALGISEEEALTGLRPNYYSFGDLLEPVIKTNLAVITKPNASTNTVKATTDRYQNNNTVQWKNGFIPDFIDKTLVTPISNFFNGLNQTLTNYNAFKNGGNINKFKKGGKKMGFLKRRRENRQKSLEMFNDFKTKIYGDAELDDKTMRQLQSVWKLNPEFMRLTAEQKAPQAPKKLISRVGQYADVPAITHIDRVVPLPDPNYTPDFSSTGANRAAFTKAFGIADKAGLKAFNWNGTTYNTNKSENWKEHWDGNPSAEGVNWANKQILDRMEPKNQKVWPKTVIPMEVPEEEAPEEDQIDYPSSINFDQADILDTIEKQKQASDNAGKSKFKMPTVVTKPAQVEEGNYYGYTGDPRDKNAFLSYFVNNDFKGKQKEFGSALLNKRITPEFKQYLQTYQPKADLAWSAYLDKFITDHNMREVLANRFGKYQGSTPMELNGKYYLPYDENNNVISPWTFKLKYGFSYKKGGRF